MKKREEDDEERGKLSPDDPLALRREMARIALATAVKFWELSQGGVVAPKLRALAPDGRQWEMYVSKQRPGLGQLFYLYHTGRVAEAMVANCERMFDEREGLSGWPAQERIGAITNMATHAISRLLVDLSARLSDAVDMAFEESLLMAEAALESGIANRVGGIADATSSVENVVNLFADRQRQRLSSRLKRMGRSEIHTPVDDRRLPKITLGRLRLAYQAAKKGKEPDEKITQTEVAGKFKRGGVSVKQLRRFGEQELGMKTWGEVLSYLEKLD